MRRVILILTTFALLAGTSAAAQIGLPGIALPRPVLDRAASQIGSVVGDVSRIAARLADQRLSAIDTLVRRNREVIEFDRDGAPARRGELLVLDADDTELADIRAAGYAVISVETIAGLDLTVARLAIPQGVSLASAQRLLSDEFPEIEVTADNLHFTAGSAEWITMAAAAPSAAASVTVPVGMIDGATGPSIIPLATKGFAAGAPFPSNHGSAVASLLAAAGASQVRVADVYGTDPAGGNALAIARALGWLVSQGSKVVTISLVGPKNPVLSRAIARAQAEGTIIVAAVGNDGPAAPPAYPASYEGVVAVTAVDGRNRALIEAGRALHLDYAAPGADVRTINAKGKSIKVRGTSFATPLVAARAAHALAAGGNWRARLDGEARDLGSKGPDKIYGRGLLCGNCAGR